MLYEPVLRCRYVGCTTARLHTARIPIHQVLVCLHGLASFLYATAATCRHRTTSLLPAAAHRRLLHYVPPVMYMHGEWDSSIYSMWLWSMVDIR
jgi:hypothetical protein